MKNILTTAGVAAVAVVGFQTTCAAQAITVDDSKWWQVSASLRGFYDDNYTAAPRDAELESFGVEVRPGLDLTHKGEQDTIKFSLLYSGRWFEDRSRNEVDHTIIADLAAEYLFTENHVLRFNDTFAWTREGTVLDQGGFQTTPTVARSDGTNLRNLADLRYVGQFTPLFGLEVGYQNTWYDFDESGPFSYSAILDRVEHLIRGETRWTITPTIAGVLGYWYEKVDFTADEAIGGGMVSDDRNSSSHYIVGGLDYTMSPQTFVSLRGGAQNVTYDNQPGEPDEWNAFGDVSVTYEYLEGSYVRIGGKYGRTRTDVAGSLDQEAGTLYGLVAHKVMEALTARLSGQVQFGNFHGGAFDDLGEGLYLLGLSLAYDINECFAIEGGYNYDRLDSDDGLRSYSRNRVFLGVRGEF